MGAFVFPLTKTPPVNNHCVELRPADMEAGWSPLKRFRNIDTISQNTCPAVWLNVSNIVFLVTKISSVYQENKN